MEGQLLRWTQALMGHRELGDGRGGRVADGRGGHVFQWDRGEVAQWDRIKVF